MELEACIDTTIALVLPTSDLDKHADADAFDVREDQSTDSESTVWLDLDLVATYRVYVEIVDDHLLLVSSAELVNVDHA